jgi:hypothetical protein
MGAVREPRRPFGVASGGDRSPEATRRRPVPGRLVNEYEPAA